MSNNLDHDSELVENAVAARDRGDYREAIDIFTDLLRRHKSSEFYHGRGTSYLSCGEFNNAIADLNVAIDLKPSDPDNYVNRGNAYLHKGELSPAISDFTRALEISPDLEQAFNSRGIAYSRLGRVEAAAADYKSAIALDNEYVPAIANLGRLLFNNRRLEDSLVLLTQAYKLKPDDATILCSRGDIFLELHQIEDALRDYLQSIYIAPTFSTPLRRLAWILATCPLDSIRDGEKALLYARRACESTSWSSGPELQALAAAYAECGKFDEAFSWQTKALALLKSSESSVARDILDLFRKSRPFRAANQSDLKRPFI